MPLKRKKILDVGCGKGELLEELFTLEHEICGVGVDLHQSELKMAHTRKVPNVHFILGDATKLPLQTQAFDIVVSSEFYEHVYDVNRALNEQTRVLNKEGKLIIEQANLLSFSTLCNLLIIYFIKTKGKMGGIRWLLNRNKVVKHGCTCSKDEDVKSILWWTDFINHSSAISLIDIYSPLSKKLKIKNIYLKTIISFFSMGLIILATKDDSRALAEIWELKPYPNIKVETPAGDLRTPLTMHG